jgi:hypothetical protein
MTGEKQRHKLSDWLALHELDLPLCRRILAAGARELDSMSVEPAPPASQDHLLDPDLAWLNAVDAMRRFFPAQRGFIDDTFENTPRVLVDDGKRSQRALTLDNGPAAYPTIMYRFRGKPSDRIVIAHEFGHALQLRASKGKFVTPIMREVCAFVGEMALLAHCRDTDAVQHDRLLHVWRDHSRKYFETDGGELELALRNQDAPYSYCWNYPIARYIATSIVEPGARDHLWATFEGKLSVGQALAVLDGYPKLD